MKTTKGGKVMNPTDAYRKELRKKELKRNKKERKKVREVGILKKDPEAIKEQIRKLEMMKADGALDKTRRHKKRQLEDTLNLVIKKRKEYEDKMREKGEEPVMFSHLPAPRRRATAEEEERAKHPKPEDSVYFHPSLNPSGAPPPGKPPMYKSAIGPRIPLAPGAAGSATSDQQLGQVPLPPPPPPPLAPADGEGTSTAGDPVISLPVPVPPPPPVPSELDKEANLGSTPPPPFPSAGLPSNRTGTAVSVSLPPLPPRLPQPPPPGIIQERPLTVEGSDSDSDESDIKRAENIASVSSEDRDLGRIPPPPPPPHRAAPSTVQDDGVADADFPAVKEQALVQRLLPPPPPPVRPPGLPVPPSLTRTPAAPSRPSSGSTQPGPGQKTSREDLPPGVSVTRPATTRHPVALPPPPPPPQRVTPPVMAPPPGPPPGPPLSLTSRPLMGLRLSGPPLMRPPPGPSPVVMNESSGLPPAPSRSSDGTGPDDIWRTGSSRPSYVKSAAATVVKRPLAQHTPELTSMVPASVRVRRENAQKFRPKAASNTGPVLTNATSRAVPAPPAVKPQSIDDSYYAFLEDMKALGAFDGGKPY